MVDAEKSSDRLIILGGTETVELVQPIAVALGLQTSLHETVSGAMEAIGPRAEDVTAAIIDTVNRQQNADDERLASLIDSLWRIKNEPFPTALLSSRAAIWHFTSRYGFGIYTETWAAMLWPPEAVIVKHWLANAVRIRKTH